MSHTRRILAGPWPVAVLVTVLSAAAMAQSGPAEKLPPDAAATPTTNSSVGSTGQVPNVAYPQAPTATPAAEGEARTRPPADREKAN